MRTSLQGIAEKAKREKKYRFRNLFGMLNEEYLIRCWSDIHKDAAYSVDRISAEEYQSNLIENVRDLVSRLKRKSYRSKLVRRHYIPKENGKLRPFGDTSRRRQAAAIGSGANVGGHLRAGFSAL